MASKNRDGIIVLLAIALLVAPIIYIALQGDADYYDEDTSNEITIGETYSLYSDVLEEDRE